MHPLILPLPAAAQTPTVPQPLVAPDTTTPARVLPAGLTFAAVLNVSQRVATDSAHRADTDPLPQQPEPDGTFADNADASDTPDTADLPTPDSDENTPDAAPAKDAVGVVQAPHRSFGRDPQMPQEITRTLRSDPDARGKNIRAPAGEGPDKPDIPQQTSLPKKPDAALPAAQTPQNTPPVRPLRSAVALPSAALGAFQMQIDGPQNAPSKAAPILSRGIPSLAPKARDPQPDTVLRTAPSSPVAEGLQSRSTAPASLSGPKELPTAQAAKAADPKTPLPASAAPTATFTQTARIDPLPVKPLAQRRQIMLPVQTPAPADPPAARTSLTTAPPQIQDSTPLQDKPAPAAPAADPKATATLPLLAPPPRASAGTPTPRPLASDQTATATPVTPTTGTAVSIAPPAVDAAGQIQLSRADRKIADQTTIPLTPTGQKPPAAQRPLGQPTPVMWTAPPLPDPSLAERADPFAPDLAPTRLHAEGASSAPALTTTLARADLPPQIMRQLAEIAPQAASRPVDITLSPEELGRVRLSLSIAEANVTVTLLAERPETLDLLRRHIDLLGQEFRALGFENIAFAFEGGTADDTPKDTDETTHQSGHSEPDTALDTPTIHLSSGADTGLDLRL